MSSTSLAVKLGQNIRKIRAAKGLTQEAVEFKSGVPRTYLGRIERAEREPSLQTIEKLLKGLDISAQELFTFDD